METEKLPNYIVKKPRNSNFIRNLQIGQEVTIDDEALIVNIKTDNI